MSLNHGSSQNLSIVPLGAGDLIDRAIRFYRKYFTTLFLIAAPPVVAGTLFSVGWLLLARTIFFTGEGYDPFESGAFAAFTFVGGLAIWFTQTVATLVVMGGASRNFVRHLLHGEPITFADTYRNAWSRFSGLTVASAIIVVVLALIGSVVFFVGAFVWLFIIGLLSLLFVSLPSAMAVIGVIVAVVGVITLFIAFAFIACRFAYVPQVMLVEDEGVFSSIGRSINLANGTSLRFAALLAFTMVATYSALAVLYIPLLWYAWFAGIDFGPLSETVSPAWYEVASQLIWQASLIVLSPVWMIGLCLLYVDQRVRLEGYDIELMAARRLGEIPDVPDQYLNPLQPAIGAKAEPRGVPATPQQSSPGITTLGLK